MTRLPGSLVMPLAAALQLNCCAHQSPAQREFRYLYVEGAYDCGSQAPDTSLQGLIEQQRSELTATLGTEASPLTSGSELEQALHVDDPRPLVVVYVGHGTNEYVTQPRPVSELCLSDGRLALEQVLSEVHPATPYTVLVADTCWSADVDARVVGKVPARRTAVLSASSRKLRTGQGGGTALGASLIHALRCGDENGDGLVDDLELLTAIKNVQGDGAAFLPRLRRQNWVPLPVLRVAARDKALASQQSCRRSATSDHRALNALVGEERLASERMFRAKPSWAARAQPQVFWGVATGDADWQAPSDTKLAVTGPKAALLSAAGILRSSEGFGLIDTGNALDVRALRSDLIVAALPHSDRQVASERIARGSWATLNDGFVWHGGLVQSIVETFDGQRVAAERLTPMPCLDSFGQCFEVKGPSPP